MPELARRIQDHLGTSYSVTEELGGGGMSRVFLARDTSLDREVVVKVIRVNVAAAVSIERFRREIMVSAGLQHPNIVPVLSAGEIDGVPYFMMPYVRGESLRARMGRGPLSIRETISVMRDVARALGHAHERGIIHRDIKPDNILLSGGAASVTDFGVAKAVSVSRRGADNPQTSAMTGVGVSLGTPAYMAPEQAAADPKLDHRADLYSLGIVAYEMLAGAPPFHGRTPQAVLSAHITERPKPIRQRRYDVPDGLVALLESCLEKEPSSRPKSATEIMRALDSIDASSGAYRSKQLDLRRSWRKYAPGAVVGVIALVAVVWGLAGALKDPTPAQQSPPNAVVPTPSLALTLDRIRTVGTDAALVATAEGLTEELSARLGLVPDVRLTAGLTIDSAGDTSVPAGNGASDLLVQGSVRRERDRVRATLRVVSVRADSIAWSGTFEGSMDSVFAFQTRVADAVFRGVNGVRAGLSTP